MKKSLNSILSILCLIAMTGCDFSSTSSSTNKSSSSSLSATSSLTTSSSTTSSSSSSSSTSTIDFGNLDTNGLIDLLKKSAEKGVAGTLTNITLEKNLGYSKSTATTTFYKNSVHTSTVDDNYGPSATYKTISNNRYYEIEDEDGSLSLSGYKIVDGEASSSLEISNENAVANISNYSNSLVSTGFGLGISIENIANCIFYNMTEGNIYQLTINYPSIDAEEVTLSYLSYIRNEDFPNYSTLNGYSAKFIFNTSRELIGLNLTQSRYDCTTFDYITGEFTQEPEVQNEYTYNYALTYGEKTSETAPAYDLSSLIANDYTVTFYQTQEYVGYDPVTYEGIYEYKDEIAPGSDVENLSYVYPVVTFSPSTASCDTLKYSYVSLEGAIYNAKVGNNVLDYIEFTKPGEIEFTFISAGGVEKTYSFNVYAPNPEYIEVDEELPSILPVNSSIYLPSCYIEPYAASQDYEYVIINGSDYATITYDPDYQAGWGDPGAYKLTATAVGTITLRAVTKADSNIYKEFEINIIEPLSEDELNSRLINNEWGYSQWGEIINASFNDNNTGYLDFGKETYYGADGSVTAENNTTFNFSWSINYSTGTLNITDETWYNRAENGTFIAYNFDYATIDLVGRSFTFVFNIVYTEYNYSYTEEYTFYPALDNTTLQTELCDKSFSGYYSDLGVNLFTMLNANGTGRLYTSNYTSEGTIETDVLTFNWSLDEKSNLIFSNLSSETFTVVVEVYDYATWELVEKTYTFTLNTTATVDKFSASKIEITLTYEGVEYTTGFNY